MFNDCEICGELGRRDTLAGEFHVVLCVEHTRRWADFCYAAPEFDALCVAETELSELRVRVTGRLHGGGNLSGLDRTYRDAKIRMRKVAKRWLAEQQAAQKEGKE